MSAEPAARQATAHRAKNQAALSLGRGNCGCRSLCTGRLREPVADLLQFAIQVARGVVALGGLLRQQPLDHPTQRRRHTAGKRLGILANDRRHSLRSASALEGPFPGRQFIQYDAERELIGLRSKICFPTRLLRRHVIDCADDSAGIGKTDGQCGIVGRAAR